ncbi:tripartite tricarboxylate transporter substrate binding protein [Ammoniphilus sp. YIM 78166]|uniref:tripartite tricarboxylate transporter substrate binding protein n=1 Tax=Ammoniphilus sp. YIM 78166 TaxID=1644106 RepID=UPI001F0F814B|nr:tripartite tricarboxylate transporter substrate binding protein [Ammoniphilus sp. YIM 78166]
MKKLMSMVLSGVMVLTLAACGSNSTSQPATPPAGDSAEKPASTEAPKSTYPEKPLTIMTPAGAGGGLDTMTRVLSKTLGNTQLVTQTITVENKPGGGQVVGSVEFANKDKGNNFKLFTTSTPFILNYIKKEGTSPVSFRDITPIARLVTESDVLAVNVDSKYQDLQSLMNDLKADASSVVFAGGSGPGSFDHLNVIYPAMKAGVDVKKIKYVSYDGGGEALTALLGGNAEVLSSDISSVYQFVEAGKVRILGVSSGERLEGKFKDVPTYREQGIDAELTNWRGFFGPANMSDDAKGYWETKIKELVATDEWKKELETQGWNDGYLSSADFIKQMEEEEAMYLEIYKQLDMAK